MPAKQPYDWKFRDTILKQVAVSWAKFPYLRLGQLLENAVGRFGVGRGEDGQPDMFNIQNEDLVKALQVMELEFCSGRSDGGGTADTLGSEPSAPKGA